MEDRRRSDDKNWDEIKKFISESRDYRIRDEMTQKIQVDNINDLNKKVGIQNGRIYKLEERAVETDAKIKQRKDNYTTIMAWITIVSTLVMAVSAGIMIFKK